MKLSNPLENSTLLAYPKGNIYQGFGENVALYMAAIGAKGHTGIDLAMPEGTRVLAAHDGVVVEVKNTPTGYGKHIRLVSPQLPDRTYWYTVYGHLGDIFVKVGQEVKAGEEMALESNTGFVISGGNQYWGNAPSGKGVHLHFGLRILKDAETGYQETYLNKGYSIINYENGLFGYIDPMPFLNNMVQLKKIKGKKDVYAIGADNKKHLLISYYTYTQGIKIGLWDTDIQEVDSLSEEDGDVIILVENE